MEPLVLRVLRRADLLVIEFQLFNLELSEDGTLVRVDSDVWAVIVVVFPPQYVAEQIFPIASSGAGTLPKPPIRTASVAAPSRPWKC